MSTYIYSLFLLRIWDYVSCNVFKTSSGEFFRTIFYHMFPTPASNLCDINEYVGMFQVPARSLVYLQSRDDILFWLKSHQYKGLKRLVWWRLESMTVTSLECIWLGVKPSLGNVIFHFPFFCSKSWKQFSNWWYIVLAMVGNILFLKGREITFPFLIFTSSHPSSSSSFVFSLFFNARNQTMENLDSIVFSLEILYFWGIIFYWKCFWSDEMEP